MLFFIFPLISYFILTRNVGAVLDAIADTGVRALISSGWGGLDEEMIKAAGPNVFALGNVPHDWLFEHVSAVVHHGGAGTTAIGLRCGKPTVIVPFFGDQVRFCFCFSEVSVVAEGFILNQPWWAAQIARRGAGPAPLPPKQLNRQTLAAAIRVALSPATREAAQKIGETIKAEVRIFFSSMRRVLKCGAVEWSQEWR